MNGPARVLPCTTLLVGLLVGLLAGCGAEVATTAVTTTRLQAQQAEAAQAQAEQIAGQLDAAMRRAEAAASAANP